MIAPLHIDERIEQIERMRFGRRLQRVVKKILPWCILDSWPPRGRKSAEMQLATRREFPKMLWAPYGSESDIVSILRIIQEQLSWPNFFFIPDDPVLFVLVGYDFDECYLMIELQRKLNVKYSMHELQTIIDERWPLGRFVSDVLERALRRDNLVN